MDGAICTCCEKSRFSMEGFKDFGAIMGEGIPDQDIVAPIPEGSFGFLRMKETLRQATLMCG